MLGSTQKTSPNFIVLIQNFTVKDNAADKYFNYFPQKHMHN